MLRKRKASELDESVDDKKRVCIRNVQESTPFTMVSVFVSKLKSQQYKQYNTIDHNLSTFNTTQSLMDIDEEKILPKNTITAMWGSYTITM